MTIIDGLDKVITFADGSTAIYTAVGIFNEDKTAVILSNSIKTFNATNYADLVTVDGSAAASTIKITGNTKANHLVGGDSNDTLSGNTGNDKLLGGAGNDSLSGGDGKDSLWGGAVDDKFYGGSGDDIFIYKPGEGTDTIFDFKSGDMLKILKADGSEGGTFTSSSFNSNNLTLAISGGGKVIFDNVSAADSFNINGTIHTISGKTLK